ncbi:uncharacterized protein LOC129573857 isoform X2 [Sitodiplosis mosellana]|uniref:uncharacterized protein LOC129573857 isoform X2 n=1 Tax=Sitodiplosis mosellana TaxID=263140 RepID=UPI002443C1C7|nr:uncharacterized protein LOC129573857 isoform X2 [Sitodiplosis mosellana]
MSSFHNVVNRQNQHATVSSISVQSALEMYLIGKRPSGIINNHDLLEYAQAQRDQMDDMNGTFGILKHDQKIEPSIFVLVKIENVISVRDFHAIQVCDLEERTEFQNVLNRAYEEDCEPIDNVKVNDLCVVLHDFNWCRAEVIGTVTERIGKIKKIKPHNLIRPFAIKCQLSMMNNEEEIRSDNEYSLSKLFENITQQTNQFLLYLNRMDGNVYTDVMLLTEEVNMTTFNTVYNAYMIHENYGAFVRPNVQFDDEISEGWSKNIVQMIKECTSDRTKKTQVFICHIVSPVEIYVRCRAAQAFMLKLRRIIDAYANSTSDKIYHNSDEFSIGMDCLVRLQNWNTECNMKQWYRGRIFDKNEHGFRIFLRDYGRRVEAIDVNDLKSIPLPLASPANAVQKCCLSLGTEMLSESSTSLLDEIVGEYEYFAISAVSKKQSVEETNLCVMLWGATANYLNNNSAAIDIWDNLGLLVVSRSIRKSMETFIKKSQRRYEKIRSNGFQFNTDSNVSEFSDEYDSLEEYDNLDDANNEVMKDFFSVSEWLTRPLQNIHIFNGLVTHINDNGIIYLQQESDVDIAYQLEQSIYNHVKMNNFNRQNHNWQEGVPCFSEFEGTGFHRAVIKTINREEGLCLIKYIDYGDKAVKRLDDLFPATNFGDIPVLAHTFFIPTLVPADKSGRWCAAVMTEFRLRLQNEMCTISIVQDARREHKNQKTLPCSIEPHILPCDIHKWLLKKKFGYKTGFNENGQDILFI